MFHAAPTIFIRTPARQLAEQAGNTIVLPCVVTADQSTKITYSWTRDGQTITPNQRIQINNGSLMLTSLQSSDEGRYVCVVRTQVVALLSALPRKLYSNVSILSVSGNAQYGNSESMKYLFQVREGLLNEATCCVEFLLEL